LLGKIAEEWPGFSVCPDNRRLGLPLKALLSRISAVYALRMAFRQQKPSAACFIPERCQRLQKEYRLRHGLLRQQSGHGGAD